MTTNVPPPPDHPGAAMYQFTHGPGLHDIQPQREGFWTLAGHDAELFRLGFVHTPPGQTTIQLVYQVFRPIKNLGDLETHASELIYEYEGDFASVPQQDEGFATLPPASSDPIHLSHSNTTEDEVSGSMQGIEAVMNQDQNIHQDEYLAEQDSAIQSGNSTISQMMPDPDAQVLSPVLDDNLLAATPGMDGTNWTFPPNVLHAQDYNVLNGTPEMNVGDLGMHQEQMVASEMPQTQEWAELPDADHNQPQGDDQMILPNF